MEEDMLESIADLEIIFGKVQRKMEFLTIPKQITVGPTRNVEDIGVGRGIFHGNPQNVRNIFPPNDAPCARHDAEVT